MKKACYGETLLSEQGSKNILTYKYAGADESLIYKYITGKLAQMLVDHVYPVNLA